MKTVQTGILAPVPDHARYLTFSLRPGGDPRIALLDLKRIISGSDTVVGLGISLIEALGNELPELPDFPSYSHSGIDIPSTPFALWCWIRGDDRGILVHLTRQIQHVLEPGFLLMETIDAFKYQGGLDLTGYEDGTENPEGEEAIEAGIVLDSGKGLDGSSYVAVQKWVHDLNRFESFPLQEQDNMIGRYKSDNEEMTNAPDSAHIQRTAQEDFDPHAFILRRSMPWANDNQEGLVFVAFGKSTNAFEVLLKRMVGLDDGIQDALFRFTKPISGSYFWCPPIHNEQLDLSLLELE